MMRDKSKPPAVIDAPVRLALHEISGVIERSPRPAAPIARYQQAQRGDGAFAEARRLARHMADDPDGSIDAQANVPRARLAPLHKPPVP